MMTGNNLGLVVCLTMSGSDSTLLRNLAFGSLTTNEGEGGMRYKGLGLLASCNLQVRPEISDGDASLCLIGAKRFFNPVNTIFFGLVVFSKTSDLKGLFLLSCINRFLIFSSLDTPRISMIGFFGN
jgi:hypothetical protein